MKRRLTGARRLAGILFFAVNVSACECPDVPLQEHFERATVVFRGYLEDTVKAKDGEQFRFTVNDVFKGEADPEETYRDEAAGSACALQFAPDQEYLVYARWEWGVYRISRCWGTKPVTEAKADAAVIGPGNAWKSKLYPKLREACMGKYTTSCCLAGVKSMEEGGYLPEPEGGCPLGKRPNRLRCRESPVWCEPHTK